MTAFDTARPRMTKAETVYEELRRQLLDGERVAGTVLSTYDLAREFGVSRRPVMDAVMRLQTAGFLEIESQVGCRVVLPSRRDLLDHMDVSTALNAAAAYLAATRITPDQLAAAQRVCDDLDEHAAAADSDAFDRDNLVFHKAIVAAADNTRLIALTDQAWDLTHFFRYPRPVSVLPMLQEEHRGILAAIRAGEGARARDLMEQHQSHARDRVGERAEVVATQGATA